MSAPVDVTTPTSVVIATRGRGGTMWGEARSFVVEAVRAMRQTSRHTELEFVVVHHDSTSDATVTALGEIPGIDLVLVPFSGPLPPAAVLNLGALHASGAVLAFLDETTHAKSDEALGHLIAPLSDPGVGAAGAKLLTPEGMVDAAGIVLRDGAAEHPWRGLPDSHETSADLFVDRTVEALDAACTAIPTDLFHTLGGWSEEIPERFRDVDLSLKVRRHGLTLSWVSDAVLWNFATPGRSAAPRRWERDFVTRRWGRDLTPAASDSSGS